MEPREDLSSELPNRDPQSPTRRIRESLADSVASHGVMPFKGLKGVILSIRSGDWEAFGREPTKRKLMALQAVLIDDYWKEEVTAWRNQHAAVHGLASPLSRNPQSTDARAISTQEWQQIKDHPDRAQRRKVTASLQLTAMLHNLSRFEDRIKTGDGALIVGGKDIHREYMRQSAMETSLGRSVGQARYEAILPKDYFSGVVRSGLEVGSSTVWILDAEIAREIATAVASSHLASFPLFRTAINMLPQVDAESVRSAAEFADAIEAAAQRPELARQIAATLLAERMTENSSYNTETTGCSALYTSAFFGLIDWVKELKEELG